jgi:hypothetical protein
MLASFCWLFQMRFLFHQHSVPNQQDVQLLFTNFPLSHVVFMCFLLFLLSDCTNSSNDTGPLCLWETRMNLLYGCFS